MIGLIQLDERVAIAGQLRLADLEDLAQMGFCAVVNNRPDGEAMFGQPSSEKVQAAAEAAGLASHYLPVELSRLGADDVRRFHAITRNANGPIIAYCKTGYRSALLWTVAEAACAGQPVDQLVARAALAGQDLSRVRGLIDRLLLEFAQTPR